MLMRLSVISSLTIGKRDVKGSLCGSIRPRTEAAARRVDTHTAGMRSQAALGKAQSPKAAETRAAMTDCPLKQHDSPSNSHFDISHLSFHLLCCCRDDAT